MRTLPTLFFLGLATSSIACAASSESPSSGEAAVEIRQDEVFARLTGAKSALAARLEDVWAVSIVNDASQPTRKFRIVDVGKDPRANEFRSTPVKENGDRVFVVSPEGDVFDTGVDLASWGYAEGAGGDEIAIEGNRFVGGEDVGVRITFRLDTAKNELEVKDGDGAPISKKRATAARTKMLAKIRDVKYASFAELEGEGVDVPEGSVRAFLVGDDATSLGSDGALALAVSYANGPTTMFLPQLRASEIQHLVPIEPGYVDLVVKETAPTPLTPSIFGVKIPAGPTAAPAATFLRKDGVG